MFDGSDLCWVPDIPTSRQDERRLKEAAFGDGYSQRMLDGINALMVRWSVTFENREGAIINAMVDYLVAQEGAAFDFLDKPTGIMHKVWCDSWQVSWNLKRKGPLYYGTLSAEFRKAYGLTV